MEVLLLLASDFPTENPSKQKRTILIRNRCHSLAKRTQKRKKLNLEN